MNRDDLLHLLRTPTQVAPQQVEELRELVEAYPYSASLVYLYLYALAKTSDVRYQAELHRLSIYLPNPRALHRMIAGEFVASTPNQPSKATTSEDPFELIDSFLEHAKASGEDLPQEILTESEGARDYFPADTTTDYDGALSELIEQSHESSSPASTAPSAADLSQADELSEALLTETLAHIYIKQGHYDKALRIINAISLNYPKKSRYFADQIRFLERLIENNKEQQ